MPLTPEERKQRLGHGGLRRIAKRLKLSEGHVSQVNSRKRTDPRVERAIARAIAAKHGIPPTEIFPPDPSVAA